MSEIEADNPTAIEEERYWNPEVDMNFTVLSVGIQLGAVCQYENGQVDLHWTNEDGTFKAEHKRLSTGDEDGLSLYDACPPKQHQFDVEPYLTDDDRATATCERCGLGYNALQYAHPDTPQGSPHLCTECGMTYTEASSAVITDDGRVCGDCRDESDVSIE